MQNLGNLKDEFRRLETRGTDRLQAQAVGLLITQVRQFVAHVIEEKKLIARGKQAEKIARRRAETPEAEEEKEKALEDVQAAKDAERNISLKISTLTALEKDTLSLLTEIRRAFKA